MDINNISVQELAYILILEYFPSRAEELVISEETKDNLKKEFFRRNYKTKQFDLKNKLPDKTLILDWIEEYRNLFDKSNIGVAGKKSTSKSCQNKMEKFLKEYNYSKQQILEATKLYISKTNPLYIRQADYFISKIVDGTETSTLATWCEEIKNQGTAFSFNITA